MDLEEYYQYLEIMGHSRADVDTMKAKYGRSKVSDTIKLNLVCRDLGIARPSEDSSTEEINIMAKKKPSMKVPISKAAVELTLEQKIEAKMEGFAAQLSFVIGAIQKTNEILVPMAQDLGVWKSYEARMMSLLETLLAGPVVSGGIKTQLPTITSPPVSITPTQTTPITQTTPVAPVATGQIPIVGFKQVPTPVVGFQPNPMITPTPIIPQLNPMLTPTAAPIAPSNSQVKAPATRLALDGSAERGLVPADKKYSFYELVVIPSEFTEKAVKVKFQFTNQDGITLSSWDTERGQAEVWVSKKLISPDTIMKRIQAQQTFLIANWWVDKNSVPIA